MAFASIPFDKGWHIYVDGKRVKAEALWGIYTKFAIPAGNHTIKLAYYPPGFILGLVVSALCLMVLIIIWIREEKALEKEEGETMEDIDST